jgi:hypothetical protein
MPRTPLNLCPADSKGLLLGNRDEPLSGLGNVQAGKVAEFLLEMKVSPASWCRALAPECILMNPGQLPCPGFGPRNFVRP